MWFKIYILVQRLRNKSLTTTKKQAVTKMLHICGEETQRKTEKKNFVNSQHYLHINGHLQY